MAARIGKDEFEEKVKKSDRAVVVDFYSDSCIACKKLSPALGQAEDALGDQYCFYKVNAHYEDQLVEEYEILSLPTLLVFQEGSETGRKTGAQNPEELIQWLTSFLNIE